MSLQRIVLRRTRVLLALVTLLSFACSDRPAADAAPKTAPKAAAKAAPKPAPQAAPAAKPEPAPIQWNLAGWSPAPVPAGAPNVVLLVVDTFARKHISGYGYWRKTTPNLDRVMHDGIRFDAAIVPSSWSPPCHTTIITGLLPIHHNVMGWGDRMADTAPPLPVFLQKIGYRTALFSSHLSLAGGVHGITAGLDHKFVEGRGDRLILETAATWIEQRHGPYFAHVIVTSPHAPYQEYPAEWDDRYFTDVPPGGEKTYPFVKKRQTGAGGIPKVMRMGDHHSVGFYVNRYDRGLLYVDSLIGDFVDRLQKEGKLSNTLLIVTADHGESHGEHDYFGHEMQLYDTLVRVPLVFWYPGHIAGGAVWKQPVQLTDVAPTILGFLGQKPSPHMDGIDLSSYLLHGTRPHKTRIALGSYQFRHVHRFMARSATHKLIYTEGGKEEFYDLVKDPDEVHNLLASGAKGLEAAHAAKAYAELRSAMNGLLKAEAKRTRYPAPAPLSDDVIKELRSLGYLSDDQTTFGR